MKANRNDWRVTSLLYAFDTENKLSISVDAPPLVLEEDVFDATLASGRLIVSLKADFSSEDAAREGVEPRLREWMMHEGLQAGRPQIRFDFQSATSINRATGRGRAVAMSNAVGPATWPSKVRDHYPPPPPRTRFALTPELEMLYARWELFIRGGTTLLDASYFCLQLIEHAFGGSEGSRSERRSAAAKVLAVSRNVLDELSILSSQGDPSVARKYTGQERPLTPEETQRLLVALPKLILHVGEVAAAGGAANLEKLTRADLRSSRRPGPRTISPPQEPPQRRTP